MSEVNYQEGHETAGQAKPVAPPVPVTSEELVKAVHFYEQLKRENPPASGNLITDSQIRQ